MVGSVNSVAIMLWTLGVANKELRETVKLWAYVFNPVKLCDKREETWRSWLQIIVDIIKWINNEKVFQVFIITLFTFR